MKENEKVSPVSQIKSRLEEAAPEIVDDMMNTLRSPSTPAAVKVRIYEILMDRLMGKPEATIRLEDSTSAMEDAEKMIATIAAKIREGGEANEEDEQ